MQVSLSRVEVRFSEFVAKYAAVLRSLQYDEATVAKNVASLTHRLATRDFKLYGERPIHMLHGGKRITRFLIKLAIECCPKEKARREQLRTQYLARAQEIRVRQPNACFFSFESAYADKLKINLANFRDMFRL